MLRISRKAKHYTTVSLAKKLGVSTQRVRVLCLSGRIAGAERVGRDWIIPADYIIKPSRNKRGGKSFTKIRQGGQA